VTWLCGEQDTFCSLPGCQSGTPLLCAIFWSSESSFQKFRTDQKSWSLSGYTQMNLDAPHATVSLEQHRRVCTPQHHPHLIKPVLVHFKPISARLPEFYLQPSLCFGKYFSIPSLRGVWKTLSSWKREYDRRQFQR